MIDLIFDMGASRTRYALVEGGHMGDVVRTDTNKTAEGLSEFLAAMDVHVGEKKLRSVVGCMPGELEGDDGRLELTPNLTQWAGQPVRKLMEERFSGASVTVFNDAVLGGIGEAHFGAGITAGVMAYYTVSSGVNGVRIIDGKVDTTIGRYELGYQLVADKAGKHQSLESRVGGVALQKEQGVSPKEVSDHQVWRSRARDLAIGIYNTCVYWDPELIVFGGSMMRDIDLKDVSKELELLPKVQDNWPSLVPAKLGDTAGLHGALAWTEKLLATT